MRTLITLIAAAITLTAAAQKRTEHLEIRTSSVCDMCEHTIETDLLYTKGVKSVDVDLSTSLVHVEYDAKKATPDDIRMALTKLGYYADEMPGDPAAFAKLPACCQKEGCGKPVRTDGAPAEHH